MTTTLALPDGVHADLPFAEYHALPAWGSSALKAMRKGPPARVSWERDNPSPETDDTKRGTAVHSRLLTPEQFAATYATKPDGMSFASKEGKAWRDDPCRAGMQFLSYAEGALVEAIAEAVLDKTLVRLSLGQAEHREVSLLATCPTTGERVKARPDWIQGGYIHDLKCSIHATRPASLSYRAFVEGWMSQLAHYRYVAGLLGLEVRGGRLVVVSPKAPHIVYCMEVKPDALDLLEMENVETLRAMRACREADAWPGSEDRWVPIEPPAAAMVEALGGIDLGGAEEA